MRHFLAAAALIALAAAASAEGQTHRVAIHVDQNDPAVMNMALNNAANVTSYYESVGDDAIIELVAYGPGLTMFIAGESPVEDRIASMSLAMPHLSFSACGNTLAAMVEQRGIDVPLITEAAIVPSGVVRLIELQEEGFAYVRP